MVTMSEKIQTTITALDEKTTDHFQAVSSLTDLIAIDAE
jgi:hypothetical protein